MQVLIDNIKYFLASATRTASVCQQEFDQRYSGDIVIPATITYDDIPYRVTHIGNEAFSHCENLTSVTIPDSVTVIGENAFEGCSGLTSIAIPKSVKRIKDNAFWWCGGLTSVVVDQDNPIYDSRNHCNAIIETATDTLMVGCQNTIVPDGVIGIGSGAFLGCKNLASVTIPNSVTSIADWAFFRCNSLTSITISNSVKSIAGSAFCGCGSLTSIVVEPNNPIYDSRNRCNAIIETATDTLIAGCQKTIIPDSITSIGDFAFNVCENLTSVSVPDGVTSIGKRAFYGCENLAFIAIPDSVTVIGDSAFFGCDSLTSIHIPNGITSIGEDTFGCCSGLTSISIPDSVTSIGAVAFEWCYGLTSICIPHSVTSIGKSAFAHCDSLASIFVPDGVTNIGAGAFENTLWLNNQPDGPVYINNILYKYKGDMPQNTHIVIRQGTLSISGGAFGECEGLVSIIIPNSVTSIGACAFYGCCSLNSLNIPDSVTKIGEWAFGHTPWLNSRSDGLIYINRVLYLYKGKMPQNTSVVVRPGTLSISGEAFSGCNGLTSLIIPEGVVSIGDRIFSNCKNHTLSVTLPASISEIGRYAFCGYIELQTIYVPQGMKEKFCKMGLESWRKKIVEISPTNRSI